MNTGAGRPHWRFAPTGGGAEQGNSTGQSYFREDAVKKMVRETVQNSLDQLEDGLDGVKMTYRLLQVRPEDIGAESLKKHIQASYNETKKRQDPETRRQYEGMLSVLDGTEIQCLAVIDANTLGLRGENWDNLIVREGVPAIAEQGQAHGGSFGFGKNATFNLSEAKTVIYSTRYVARAAKGKVTRMMGRSQLQTHDGPDTGERLQSIGFYALHDGTENNRPIEGPNIPEVFRLQESGTGIFIVAFDPWKRNEWMDQVKDTVVTNFFPAIREGKLEVTAANDGSGEQRKIDRNNLEILIEELPNEDPTQHYLRAMLEEPTVTGPRTNPSRSLFEKEIPRVKRLRLWINTGREAPKRLAHVNRRGMLITDRGIRAGNPLSPYGGGQWAPWTAVTMADDEETERAIRMMEPPAHNEILPGRLESPEERRRAEEDLAHHREQIRKAIIQRIDDRLNEQTSNVTELAELFPGVPWEKNGTDHEVTRRNAGAGRENVIDIEREGEEDDEDKPDDERAGPPPDVDRTKPPKNDRERGGPKGTYLRDARILRTSSDTLEMTLLTPKEKMGTIRFGLRAAGEQYQRNEQEIDVREVSHHGDITTRVRLEDGEIAIDALENTRVELTLTLAERDTKYQSYRLAAR